MINETLRAKYESTFVDVYGEDPTLNIFREIIGDRIRNELFDFRYF